MNCVNCGRATKTLETRPENDGMVNRRRRECSHCALRFNSFEIDEGLLKTLRKYLRPHVKALAKRQELTRRNELIVARLRAGAKHAVLANEFGLSDNMISTIARRNGVPAYAKQRGVF